MHSKQTEMHQNPDILFAQKHNVIPESESSHDNFMVNISQCAIEKIIHHISGYFYFCNKKLNSTAKLGEKHPCKRALHFKKYCKNEKKE